MLLTYGYDKKYQVKTLWHRYRINFVDRVCRRTKRIIEDNRDRRNSLSRNKRRLYMRLSASTTDYRKDYCKR